MWKNIVLVASFFLCSSISDVDGKIWDLSHVHKPTTFVFPDVKPFNLTSAFKGMMFPNVYVETGYYTVAEHSGTHLDAPSHFIQDGISLEDVTVEMTIAEGVMIDCTEEAKQNPSYSVPVSKLLEWEKQNGPIPYEAAVLFNFGWSLKYEDHAAYKGSPDQGQYEFPFISEEAAMWLFNQRRLKIVGVDTLSPDSMDPRQGERYPLHITYLQNNRLIIENLNDLSQLPPRGFRFYATPVKYMGSTGTQVRAFAVPLDQDVYSGSNVNSASLFTFLVLALLSAVLL